MEHSEQLNELAAALAKAQGEFSSIPKTETNPFFKSKYAGLPQVVEAASPILSPLGLSVSQFLGYDDQGDTLTTYLLHSSGQFIRHTMRLHLTKEDAQGQGSATTYARRYSYMAVLGLVADEDDDGNAASQPRAPKAPRKPVEPPTEPVEAELLSQEHIAELMTLAKRKGYATKEAAVAFLDAQALGPFTKLPDYQFEAFKKVVTEAGWKKSDAL